MSLASNNQTTQSMDQPIQSPPPPDESKQRVRNFLDTVMKRWPLSSDRPSTPDGIISPEGDDTPISFPQTPNGASPVVTNGSARKVNPMRAAKRDSVPSSNMVEDPESPVLPYVLLQRCSLSMKLPLILFIGSMNPPHHLP